jgi:hypothetical protein
MIRFYSLFVNDEKVVPSPYSQRFNPFHDLTLRRGETETVNFLLQTSLTAEQYEKMNVLFDPEVLDVKQISVRSFSHQTLVTATLSPKQSGSLRIGFAFPQSPHLHRTHLKRVLSPFISLPCQYFSHSLRPAETPTPMHASSSKKEQFVAT